MNKEEIMKKTIKAIHIALAVSSLAVIITGISLFISGFEGSQVIIFCCMIAIFCANLAIYSSEKENNKD